MFYFVKQNVIAKKSLIWYYNAIRVIEVNLKHFWNGGWMHKCVRTALNNISIYFQSDTIVVLYHPIFKEHTLCVFWRNLSTLFILFDQFASHVDLLQRNHNILYLFCVALFLLFAEEDLKSWIVPKGHKVIITLKIFF